MNATFLLLSTAWIASADAAPAPVMASAPVVVSSAGCNGCGSVAAPSYTSSYAMASSCDSSPCGPRMGLFARLKAKLHGSRSHCHSSCAAPTSCAPACAAPAPACAAPAPVACAAPAPCAPACGTPLISQPLFTGFTTSACGCGSSKIGLLDRLRAKFKHSSSCDSCGSASSACGSTSAQIGVASSPCSVGPAMVAPAAPVSPPKEMPAPVKEEPKKEEPKKQTTQAPDTLRIPELGATAGKY